MAAAEPIEPAPRDLEAQHPLIAEIDVLAGGRLDLRHALLRPPQVIDGRLKTIILRDGTAKSPRKARRQSCKKPKPDCEREFKNPNLATIGVPFM